MILATYIFIGRAPVRLRIAPVGRRTPKGSVANDCMFFSFGDSFLMFEKRVECFRLTKRIVVIFKAKVLWNPRV